MKSFKDIVFKPHSMGNGLHGLAFFPNGYGISVVRFKVPGSISKDGVRYGSYTSDENEWEVAVLYGNENDWDITYNTPIAEDVIGYQTEVGVDWIMIQIQSL
jgi:hypothetical protein